MRAMNNPVNRPARRTPANNGAEVVFNAALQAVQKHLLGGSFLQMGAAEYYLRQLCFGGHKDRLTVEIISQMNPTTQRIVRQRFVTTCQFKSQYLRQFILPGMGQKWFKENRCYSDNVIAGNKLIPVPVMPIIAVKFSQPVQNSQVETEPYNYGQAVFDTTVIAVSRAVPEADDRRAVTDFIAELCFKPEKGDSSTSWVLTSSERTLIMRYFKTSCDRCLHQSVTLPGMLRNDYKSTRNFGQTKLMVSA